MTGYRDCNVPELQPPEDPNEEAFILAHESIIELLENNGYEIVATKLSYSKDWVNAINAHIAEQNQRKNEF